jgi:cytochrome c biogenesis protein CcmG, thiol:disulfide interchange protein DsbE
MKTIFKDRKSLSSGILILAALWILLTTWLVPEPSGKKISIPREGFTAPDGIFHDGSGNSIHLANLQGEVIVLNFWASWCPPCRTEMPVIQKVSNQNLGKKVQIIGVNATSRDTMANATKFVKNYGLTFQIVYDIDGSATRQYQIQSFPTTFFIDQKGIVRDVLIGGPLSEAALSSRIEKLLRENP